MSALVVPQLSLSMEEAKVTRWLVDHGAMVAAGELVVELETDKATVEVEAPEAGVLRIVAEEGATVAVDGVLAEIAPVLATQAQSAEQHPAGAGAAPPTPRDGARAASRNDAAEPRRPGTVASPAARRIAREEGLDLAGIQGSGPGGRIVARDVGVAPAEGRRPPAAGDDRLRTAVVASITESWRQIPHVHIGGELAADGVLRARGTATSATVTITDVLVVALAGALREVPELNAVLLPDGSVQRSGPVHLSLAVATSNGVVAPVLRDADSLTLADVAHERSRLVTAARQGTLDGHELAGGTCTLSNLGAHPVDFFAPVVSGPQVAMVATGRIADKPVALDGLVGVRPRMWVNVAIDHRAADGEAGGRLLAALERQIALLPGGSG